MRKLGIAAKLYLAFGGIFLLALVASSIGWKGFSRITESQNSVIDHAIPGLRHAHRLSELNASIGALSLRLLRAANEQERLDSSAALFSEVDQLTALLDEFREEGFSPESLQPLRRTVGVIEEKLRSQNELVRRRIRQQARFTQLESSLIATTEELNDLADSLVANAAATTTAITSSLYDLVAADVDDPRLYEVFDRLVEVDLDAMERMYELRLRSANLNGLFNRVAKESETEKLRELRERTGETLSILKRRVSEINDPQRRQKATALLAAMEVDNGPLYVYGIFETRVSLLEIARSLERLSRETAEASQTLNGIVSELNVAGGTLINQVSTTAKQSLDTSRRLFGAVSIVMLLVAAAILWWFIKRNVVRRLLSLQAATHAITQGDYDVDIVVEGHDELTDMGRALHGFRNNAIHNRRLDEELRRHKAHLEELVEQRSEQLRKANQLLSDEVRDHAVAREKAEQANQAKTAFLATMSHELRTPLSGALGTLKLLTETGLDRHQLEYVNLVNAANLSLLDIVNDILGYSQLEAGKLRLDNRRFDLVELLDNVVGLMTVSAREKNNILRLDTENEKPLWLSGDPGKLHQILINLVGNANKFTDNGRITLRMTCAPSDTRGCMTTRFSVIDTGIGIASDMQQEIFQAFTQVDAGIARRYGGIGLGLAICDRLVGAMGGQISLRSQPGRGTEIGFEVDFGIGGEVEQVPARQKLLGATAAPICVLMVEDDPTNSMVTRSYLQQLGHRVLAAQSGEQALRMLDRGEMSLVLLDISLPGIDGLAILEQIRANSRESIARLPVIAMSAHVFNEEVDQYLAAGMNGFLGKPFSLEDLEDAIARTLSGNEFVIARPARDEERDDLVTIDVSVVDGDIDRLGPARVEQLVQVFLRSAAEMKVELLDAMSNDDLAAVEKLAHKLNGSAGNFGLEVLCSLLAGFEKQAGDAIPVSSVDRERFLQAFGEAIAALEALLAKRAGRPEKISASI